MACESEAIARGSDVTIIWQFFSKRTIVFFCYGLNSPPLANFDIKCCFLKQKCFTRKTPTGLPKIGENRQN
jgi:hypothetical protein